MKIWNRTCDSELYKPYSETVKGRRGFPGEESTENKHRETNNDLSVTWIKIKRGKRTL